MKIELALVALAAVLPAMAQVPQATPQVTVQSFMPCDVQATSCSAAMTSGQRWNDFVSTSRASPSVALRC
jgi:hypothetical protein